MLRRLLKWFGLVFVVTALGSFLVYDLVQFQPRRHEIDALLEADGPEKNPPPSLLRLQRADARGHITVAATRSLLQELDRGSARLTTAAYVRRSLLWHLLVKIHLSDDEQFLVERRLAFFGKDLRGYEAGSRSIFGRSLDRLSEQELAELVVIARWPTRFRDPTYSEQVRVWAQLLLSQARDQQ